MSVAKKVFEFMGLFESELLVELMLRFWRHPLADDREFRNDLLELATEALRTSIAGTQLIESLPPGDMNLIAAVYYAEWSNLANLGENQVDYYLERNEWLRTVRHAVPSCFCRPDELS